MNSSIKETWSQTHPAVKSVVVVVGVALAGFVLYKIYKTVAGAIATAIRALPTISIVSSDPT
jgi:hypothetical protein